MASVDKLELMNRAAVNAVTGDTRSLEGKQKDYLAYLKVSSYVSGTITPLIEHSPDGTNWFTLVAFTPIGTNGIESVNLGVAVYPNVRARTTGVGSATVLIELFFDK